MAEVSEQAVQAAAEQQQQETAAAAEQEQQVTNEASESATEENESNAEGEQQQGKPKGGFQKKIDKLTRTLSDKDREIEYLRRIALGNQRQPGDKSETEAKPVAVVADAKPKAEDYETHDEFVEALTDWKIDQRNKAEQTATREQQVKAERKTNLEKFQEKQAALIADDPDYEDYVEDVTNMSPAMIEEVVTHEHGPQLHRFLLQNPDQAKRLSTLSPVALAREIGRLESRFVAQQTQQRTAAPVSKAPAPPKVSGRSSSNSDDDWQNTTDFKKFEAGYAKAYPGRR